MLLVACLCAPALAEEEPQTTEPPAEKPSPAAPRPRSLDSPAPGIVRYESRENGLALGGRFALDLVKYGHANERDSGFEFDDARLILAGRSGPFQLWVEPDLLGADTLRSLYEAWVGWDPHEDVRVRAGQVRIALGSEFATREENLPLAGYAFTSHLDGRYDLGIEADGSLFDGALWGEAFATIGNGFDLEGNRLTSPMYGLRVVARPFGWAEPEEDGALAILRGVYAGAGVAWLTDFDDPLVLATPHESIVFTSPDLEGDAGRFLHLEAGFSRGPFRLGWETVSGEASGVPVGGGKEQKMDQLDAWTMFASWNVTGEAQVLRRGRWVEPDPHRRGEPWPGRWEIAARYSNADIDRTLFDEGITDYDPSTQEVRTFGLHLTWHPVRTFRVGFGWVRTLADHELTTFGDTNRDSSFTLRFELNL
jgi:hypothetical protein